MESRTTCTRCGTDRVTGPLRYSEEERLCGACVHDETGEGKVVTCVECGERVDINYQNELAVQPDRERCCFSCGYWRLHVAKKDDPTVVRANGHHYIIDSPFSKSKGFDGARFVIEFFDGRREVTENLWSQGAIPEHFRSRLPDNAKFD